MYSLYAIQFKICSSNNVVNEDRKQSGGWKTAYDLYSNQVVVVGHSTLNIMWRKKKRRHKWQLYFYFYFLSYLSAPIYSDFLVLIYVFFLMKVVLIYVLIITLYSICNSNHFKYKVWNVIFQKSYLSKRWIKFHMPTNKIGKGWSFAFLPNFLFCPLTLWQNLNRYNYLMFCLLYISRINWNISFLKINSSILRE